MFSQMKSDVCQGDGQFDEPRRKELPPHDALPDSTAYIQKHEPLTNLTI